MKAEILFFDLDGTIVDSGEGIMKCARHALSHFGIEEPLDKLRKFVGPPLEDAFADFYGFTPDETQEAVRVFRERYFEKGINEQHLYPGVVEFLTSLRERGFKTAITTSKIQHQAVKVVGEIFPALQSCFDKVFARDNAGIIHTKADVIREALSYFGVDPLSEPGRVIMIGDRKYDILGAKETGLRSIGVSYGYGSEAELNESGATAIAEDFDKLMSLLEYPA